jgi:hypothetical protein
MSFQIQVSLSGRLLALSPADSTIAGRAWLEIMLAPRRPRGPVAGSAS